MQLNHFILFFLAVALLGFYILGSEVVERSPRWGGLGRNRFSYALALGVYATTWTLFGSVGFAATEGYDFLAIYFGVTLSCIAIPFLWAPVAELVDRYRLGSIADVFAFRYQSRTLGAAVSIFMVAGLLPYIALQLRAVADGAAILVGEEPSEELGSVYALLLSAFAVTLGVRYADGRAHRPGLIATLAFESLFKLVALLVVGGSVLFTAFGGVRHLNEYLQARPDLVENMVNPVMGDSWIALVFVTFCAAFLLPRQFFVAFVQRPGPRSLNTARWALPLYLFAINLPVPILYWAGRDLAAPGVRPDVYVLVAVQSSPALQTLAFLGAVSAASAMILVSSIALSGMVANYLVPRFGPSPESLLTRWAVFRRSTIIGVVVAGLLIHFTLPRTRSLVDLGLASFVAVTHLLPGLLGALFWRRATRAGVLAGLVVGAISWALLTASPLFGVELDVSRLYALFGFTDAAERGSAIWLSLTAHAFVFMGVSLLTARSPEERNAAEACREPRVTRLLQMPDSAESLQERLTSYVGKRTAIEEIYQAATAADVHWPPRDRPELLRLITELEGRLSERIGPLAARTYVQGGRPVRADALAERLRAFRELDSRYAAGTQRNSPAQAARRYLSQLMSELPVGVCTVDDHEDVVVWNAQLVRMSGLDEDDICGHPMQDIPDPWWPLFDELAHQPTGSVIEREYDLGDGTIELRAQTATIPGESEEGRVFVVEDVTALRQLERHVAHKDRLSSIGTLASGVAHEVGNPLTGILMVAKNLATDPGADDAADRLGIIVDEAQRIHGIVQSLLTFSRRDETPVELQAIPVAAVIRNAAELAKLETDGCRIDLDLSMDAPAMASPDGLTQVLVNLLNNARQACSSGATVYVRTRAENGSVLIDVDDEGPGIPEELSTRVFEPFFTTKSHGQGTGLGLSVSRQIVERFGGSLRYEPRRSGGSRFTITLQAYEN
ncbi:MAG: PAS domain S-box protein [Deltaproteobacteria bacterium]|nr:PAS domain S-box protein [Deltaproteobacteria bacterium]